MHQVLEQVTLAPLRVTSVTPSVQRLRWEAITTPVEIVLSNDGDTELTFALKHSSDDAATDPYAALTLRQRGANVTSIAVAPGGVETAIVEGFGTAPGGVKSWLLVQVTETAGLGRVELRGATGRMWRASEHKTTLVT
jgi:hypothetical protein